MKEDMKEDMKEKKIFDAVGQVDDALIEQAAAAKLKRRIPAWQRWAALAACAALAIVIVLPSLQKQGGIPGAQAIMDVVFPKAYAYDDYEAMRETLRQNPVEEGFIDAVNGFSYTSAARVFADAGGNTNYSPLSLYYALALAASGADGATQAELLALLGVSDAQALSEQCASLYRALYRDNDIGRLKIANSIWMDADMNGDPVEFKDGFVKNAAGNFYASSHSVDFADKSAGKAMARWISQNTNGMLTPSYETDPQQILTILNTVYFTDQWTDRFDRSQTAPDAFRLSGGGEVRCDFMNQRFHSAGFAAGDGFVRAWLALKNGGRMVFILPDEGVSPWELLSCAQRARQAFAGGQEGHGEVIWKVPKFGFGSDLDLIDVLRDLGITSAFAPDADFSGITDHMAFIGGVRQQTRIAIDENGVEAAAFTKIDFFGSAPPDGRAEMILDRPFVFGITAPNGVLLFIGVCENPAG